MLAIHGVIHLAHVRGLLSHCPGRSQEQGESYDQIGSHLYMYFLLFII